MNEIFAVEPAAFEDHRDLRYLLSKFGFHEGRFIAKFPGGWKKAVIEHLGNLPDVERARAVEILKSCDPDSFISLGSDYKPESSWIENATPLKGRSDVADLIVSRRNAGQFPSLDDIGDQYFYRWGGRQAEVMSSAEGYAEAARILLQVSHEVALFDPYFRELNSRYSKVFRHFSKIALEGRCRYIIVFTMEDGRSSPEQVVRGCKQFFSGPTPDRVAVTFHLLRDTGAPDADNHGRFLVSTKGAIQFDRGFDEESTPRLRKVAFLDRPIHDKLCKQFLEGDLPFQVIQTIQCP